MPGKPRSIIEGPAGECTIAIQIPVAKGVDVSYHNHSRKDGQPGYVWLIINNAKDATTVALPKDAVRYTLSGDGKLRSRVMLLNGKPLTLGENDELPCLCGEAQAAGTVELAPGTCTFFVHIQDGVFWLIALFVMYFVFLKWHPSAFGR